MEKNYDLGNEMNERVRKKLSQRHENFEDISKTLEMMANDMPGEPLDKGFSREYVQFGQKMINYRIEGEVSEPVYLLSSEESKKSNYKVWHKPTVSRASGQINE